MKRIHDPTEIRFAAGAVGILTLVWFQWDVEEIITLFLLPIYWLLILALLLALMVFALIQVFRRRKSVRLRRLLIPPAIVAVLILIIKTGLLTGAYLELDFLVKRAEREEVVQLIKQGKIDLDSKTNGIVALPKKYARLSRGGKVRIEISEKGVNTFFYTFRGILDNFSGFVYLAEDSETALRSFIRDDDDLRQIVKKREHWYWVVSA